MVTYQVVYHNSNGATINMLSNDFKESYQFGEKKVHHKPDKTSIVHDPNTVWRVYTWTTVLTRAVKDTLDGYIRPASVVTYDATYPKIVWQKDGATPENIIGMLIGCEVLMFSDGYYMVRLTFEERYS